VTGQGKFDVYAPVVDHWDIFFLGSPQIGLYSGHLSLGDWNIDGSNQNGMSFKAYVHCPDSTSPTSIAGEAGFTQLITGAYTNTINKVLADYQLDDKLWVNSPNTVYSTVLSEIPFHDEPHESIPYHVLCDEIGMNLAFKTYLRFRPEAGNADDNIFVTLKLITWNVNASAQFDSNLQQWVANNGWVVGGPTIVTTREFPVWTNKFSP